MSEATATFSTVSPSDATRLIEKLSTELVSLLTLSSSYYREDDANYIEDDDAREQKSIPLLEMAEPIALTLAKIKAPTVSAMITRARALKIGYPDCVNGDGSNLASSALIKAVVTDLATLSETMPAIVVKQAAPPEQPCCTPEQFEELIQFAKDCYTIAETTARIALHRIPEILAYLPMSETEEAKEVALCIRHVSEYTVELTDARLRLEKANVKIWR